MSAIFEEVYVLDYDDDSLSFRKRWPGPLTLEVIDESDKLLIRSKNVHKDAISNGFSSVQQNSPSDFSIEIYKDTPCAEFGGSRSSANTNQKAGGFVITDENDQSVFLRFTKRHLYDSTKSNYTESDINRFAKLVNDFKQGRKESVFTMRTDEASATQYFQFYGYLSQQQNMMQDYIRTSTYQRAILFNMDDFRGKVVLDVGAGSGILSFFAAQAGARKVYAVEASSMAKHAETLVEANKLSDRIVVIPGKIEEIQLPEQVDIIISEPMGYMLFNERMLETYLHAKKWLAPGGNMFPTRGDLHVAPFSDAQLFTEQLTKANFWYQQNFHGVDLTSLRNAALKEYFYQPVVDTFDIRICVAKSVKHTVDFLKAHENDLHTIEIPLKFQIMQTDEIHGLAFWFDVGFFGSQKEIWLSTAPTQPLTHWYQVRCLIDKPLFVQRGHTVSGRVVLVSNRRQSYNVQIDLQVDDIPGSAASNNLDLKNPYFRYTGAPIQPPPGCNNTSPSEDYWTLLDHNQQPQQQNGQAIVVNGVQAGAANGSSVILNGTALANGIQVAQLNTGPQSLQHPVNLTSQFDQQFGVGGGSQLLLNPQPAHQHSTLLNSTTNQHVSSRLTASPGAGQPQISAGNAAISNPYGSPIGTSSMLSGLPSLLNGSHLTGGGQQQQTSVVAGINNMNFPVNQSLMIGDYAAAVGGQTIPPPFKPI